MKLVLDTNIVVSAFINPQGIPSRIMWIVLNRKAELIYNSVILSEYESVMLRPKFSSKINPGAIRQFIDLIRSIAMSFNPVISKIKLPDESDRIFFDTAKQSGSILISGNLKHYPKESFIMSPTEFLKLK